MSLDHIGIPIPFDEYQQAKQFYVSTLDTLGYKLKMEFDKEDALVAGFGNYQPTFWIGASKKKEIVRSTDTSYRTGFHIAFAAKSRKDVDRWYNQAILLGAQDNGKPGFRPHYHSHYYGAFVIDRYGNNIEAVNHFDPSVFFPLSVVIPVTVAVIAGIAYKYFIPL